MIRTLDSRLRGRGFDSQLFRFQISMVETLCIFKSDSKILRMCRIPTNCLSAIRIPSFLSDAIVVYINSRPFCTGQPYYVRAQMDNGAFINYIRSGGIVQYFMNGRLRSVRVYEGSLRLINSDYL